LRWIAMPLSYAADSSQALPGAATLPSRPWRWGLVAAGVVLAHAVAALWLVRHRDAFAPDIAKPPVEVALLTPERIAREPAPGATRTPAAPRAARVRREKAPQHVLQSIAPDAPRAAAQSPSADAATAASTRQGNASATTAAGGASADGAGTAQDKAVGVKFSVPPSGNLNYDTFYNGVQNAPGTIQWTSDATGYQIVVSVPLPFVGTFTYASEGRIDAFGLAPERYVERRGRRPEQVTTFDRTAHRIAFTRTSATLALPDGAQDRFSMVMQLASLVRGNPDAYRPGVTRNFYVADDDSGETWPIETVGDETVRTAAGYIGARHFTRAPRHAGDMRRIDVWLAPALGWLPARITQTEPNGTRIELVWRGPLAAPGAENASAQMTTGERPDVVPVPVPTREEP
jgi:hypothetical protein